MDFLKLHEFLKLILMENSANGVDKTEMGITSERISGGRTLKRFLKANSAYKSDF